MADSSESPLAEKLRGGEIVFASPRLPPPECAMQRLQVGAGLRQAGFPRVRFLHHRSRIFSCVDKRQPAMLIADTQLLGSVPSEVLANVRWCAERTAVLVFSSASSEELEAEFLLSGARGCMRDGFLGGELVKAITAVAYGDLWFGRRVMVRALAQLNGYAPVKITAPGIASLTARETVVVQQVAHGLTNKEVARQLGISDKTVKTHLQNIFRKQEVHRRAGLDRV